MMLTDMEDEILPISGRFRGVVPAYGGHALSDVPGTVAHILTGHEKGSSLSREHIPDIVAGDASKVVLFYIDGVSYDYVSGLSGDHGFMGRMVRKGAVSPITTVFPSTTAAACTSLNTGLTPLEHGMLEWQLYYHETGALIYTLPFRAVTSKYSTRARRLQPSALFTGKTIYSRLRDEGARSFVLVNRNISKGAYSDLIFEGSTVVPYSYITDCIIQLRRILENEKGPLYAYVYIESADAVGHMYGPGTEMYRAEASSISRIIKYELLDRMDPVTADDVAVILTSDHGQMDVDPRSTYYLDSIPGIWSSFQEHMGRPIPPVGSPRDLFLHVKDSMLHDSMESLSGSLDGMASVFTVKDAVDEGIFGHGKAHEKFTLRSGNIMILPGISETVWYRMQGQMPFHLKGLHGGLSRGEMAIPFGIARLSHLL